MCVAGVSSYCGASRAGGGFGGSLSRGWERALCREEAGLPTAEPEPADHSLEVSTAVPPLHPPLLFYSSITKKVGKQAVTEQHSTYRPVCEEGALGGSWESLNVTIIDRYLCGTRMRPALQPAVVGSLQHSTNKDDFSMPQVKTGYVTAVLTMRQVCFRSRILFCVTAPSAMCRAQLWELDDGCAVGAIDGA